MNSEKPIIEVRGMGKKYRINHHHDQYVALRDVFAGFFKGSRTRKVRSLRGTIGFGEKEDFWALRDIDFSVNAGEVVGIIGHNGAGKSTLLKILTGITLPTEGEAVMRGKVSSLLEVGVGFHPELTGRENIFLNGAILGMTRAEIRRNFDKIVDFSGVEKFLDTPVRYYSSGMYVRLAFSVAAHLEPDVLLVDEVLAVGDAEFQQKCLGKMREVTQEDGRTILFVSHNMAAIQSLCSRSILLDKGRVIASGPTSDVIEAYLHTANTEEAVYTFPKNPAKKMQLRSIHILDENSKPRTHLQTDAPFQIVIEYDVNETTSATHLGLNLTSQNNAPVAAIADTEQFPELLRQRVPGSYRTTYAFPVGGSISLHPGVYFLRISLEEQGRVYDQLQDVRLSFIGKKEDSDFVRTNMRPITQVSGEWRTETI